MTAIEDLVAFAGRRYGSGVPAEVLHGSRRAIVSVLGASVGAADAPVVVIADEWAASKAPPRERAPAHILWRGGTRAPDDAAFVNGVMLHALNFDDVYLPASTHPSAAVFSAALAVAEEVDASGTHFLNAFALGVQVTLATARMLAPSHHARGFHASATTGAVGAAAACAILRNLDRDESCDALGIAMGGASGLNRLFGTMTKTYHIGNAARTGVVAADLAARGFTSQREGFEGKQGMLRAMSDESTEKIDSILESLDDDWPILQTNTRAFPLGESQQAPVEAVLDVRGRTPDHRADSVERMVVRVTPYTEAGVGRFPHRSEKNLDMPTRLRPTTPYEARFNLQYCMAVAWIALRFTEKELEPEAIANEQTLALRDKITVIADPDLSMEQCVLKVEFADGTHATSGIDRYTGSAQNPLSDSAVERRLLDAAGGRLDESRGRLLLDTIWGIERLGHVRDLVSMLVL
jgi:2-methylcitrate dehydratase PrpD